MPAARSTGSRWRSSASRLVRARSASSGSRSVTSPTVWGRSAQASKALPPLKSTRTKVSSSGAGRGGQAGHQRAEELGLAGAGGAADEGVGAVGDEVEDDGRPAGAEADRRPAAAPFLAPPVGDRRRRRRRAELEQVEEIDLRRQLMSCMEVGIGQSGQRPRRTPPRWWHRCPRRRG